MKKGYRDKLITTDGYKIYVVKRKNWGRNLMSFVIKNNNYLKKELMASIYGFFRYRRYMEFDVSWFDLFRFLRMSWRSHLRKKKRFLL